MNTSRRIARTAAVAAIVLTILHASYAAKPAEAAEDFHAYLMPALPDTLHASLGSAAELSFWVDSSAHRFNAYEVSIEYDPSILAVESVEEGLLFTDACPNRYSRTTIGEGTATYTHVLLCAGVSVDGPGTLCKFTISPLAAGITNVTIISDADRTFYDAGYFVWPQHPDYPRQVVFHNAIVKVIDPTAGIDGAADLYDEQSMPMLEVRPNPVSDSAHLHFRLPEPCEVELRIVDPAGRLIWSWSDPQAAAGWSSVAWNRRDSSDRTAPAGIYYCRMRTGEYSTSAKILILP